MSVVGIVIVCLYIIELQQPQHHQLTWSNNDSDVESQDMRVKRMTNDGNVAVRFE